MTQSSEREPHPEPQVDVVQSLQTDHSSPSAQEPLKETTPPSQPPSSLQEIKADRRKSFRDGFLYPLLVAAITFLMTLGIQWVLGPHDEGAIIALMNQEAQAAVTHNLGLLANIYDSQAVVMDAGCQTPGQGTVWTGLTQIINRYSTLGQFTSLEHSDPQISWSPNSFLATKAYVSATTIGGMASSATPIHGNERWTFSKINGQWLITLFTYNFC